MHFVEMKICEKVGKIIVECQKNYQKDDLLLVRTWLLSDTYAKILDEDVVLCSQAVTYIAKVFMEENKNRMIENIKPQVISSEILYWFGYLITYWCIEYNELPKNIAYSYNISSILESYEVLHSLSIKTEISKIKEDCVL
ncbi:MAG: hypothetical protein R3Y24_07050 [Eubacteriales bacterium]